MAFAHRVSRFAAPGPFGSMNLRAALASARAADAISPPPPMPQQIQVRSSFAHPADPEAGPARGPVTPKALQDPEAGPATDRIVPKAPVSKAPVAPMRSMTRGAGPSGLIAGTLIETEAGRIPAEQIAVGDRVLTADDGAARVLWTATIQVPAMGDEAPVRFARDVLHNDSPLIVSPTQRVLISGPEVVRFNGTRDALIAAHALVDGRAISRVEGGTATYILILLDRHHLIWAGNTLVESFYPDLDRIAALPNDLLTDFARHVPDIAEDPSGYGAPVRPVLHDLEAVALAG